MPAQQVNITLGTAGHIDHGKTALVKLLTGCDTDTLKEEKERGMSIELGFAPCVIANLEVGIVDVPGHEHFIKTMVAGATGMDGVILVVAADDGIMPQTQEHLDILTLLGLEHGIIALTKIDRAGPERLAAVQDDLRRLLRGTFLEAAPILPVSNITGEGLDGFVKALQALVRSIQPKTAEGVFRLPVEKVFSIKGHGTVVTGIPLTGSAKLGDEIVLLPQGLAGRITGLQVYGREADTVLAGQCAAVNVRHWDAKTVHRGNTITVPGFFAPADWYACRLRLLAREKFSLKHAAEVKFHTGTSEVLGTVYLMQGDRASAGEECLVQLRLDAPLIAGPGDRFILRTASPPATIGGGIIVEATPRRLKRNQPEVQQDLAARAQAVLSAKGFVEYCLRTAESVAATEAEVAYRSKTPPARLREILKELVGAGQAALLAPGLYIHTETAREAEQRLAGLLGDFHKQSPQSPGMELEALAAASGMAKNVLASLLARLKAAGKTAERSGRFALATHRETFADKDRQAMERVEALFRERLFSPPGTAEAAAGARIS
ncbi:MAG: selenocysteine-specific translation elongation factor, partial [Planctomycetota bacterium]|nr:selenocysteine-specific translation elongation factor [Planctomycetota bacterium]